LQNISHHPRTVKSFTEERPSLPTLYPLRFEPIFQSMLWGGQRLPDLVRAPATTTEPIGEAWILSDVDGSVSRIANGPLAGTSLRDLLQQHSRELFGSQIPASGRFPLLLKFIDARQELSVQVHPNDEQAERLKGSGARGKTESWVILDADATSSKLYAGFREGTDEPTFRAAMQAKTTPATLHSYTPQRGDCLHLEAGTVHAIGANVLLFEVQQTSDITYRLYDWDRIDAKTGRGRDLHIEEGLHCADFSRGPCLPVQPQRRGTSEQLVNCRYFSLNRHRISRPTVLGQFGECRVFVCTEGSGTFANEPFQMGDAVMLPASIGVAKLVPNGTLELLECSLGAN